MNQYFVTISVDGMTLDEADNLLAFIVQRRGSLDGVTVSYNKEDSDE